MELAGGISRRGTAAWLIAALAICAAVSLSELRTTGWLFSVSPQHDFRVYYVAAKLVREHESLHLYDDAGNGVAAMLRYAGDSSVMATVARNQGIPRTQLYIYPPFLADLLLPFTLFPVTTAEGLWRAWNFLCLATGCVCLSRLLGRKQARSHSLVLFGSLLCIAPLWQGLHYGQITIVLFALWCAGIMFYARGRPAESAILLALATLIKMTPLAVLIPILIWRDWRWLRWFGCASVAGTLLMCAINGVGVVFFYFHHVVPAMSSGITDYANKTIASAVGFLLHGQHSPLRVAGAPATAIAKTLSALVLLIAATLLYRSRRGLAKEAQAAALAAVALLSVCTAPVSWLDTYIIGFILLALLWNDALNNDVGPAWVLLLFAATLAMGTTVGPGILCKGIEDSRAYQFAPLVAGILLALVALAGDRSMEPFRRARDCI